MGLKSTTIYKNAANESKTKQPTARTNQAFIKRYEDSEIQSRLPIWKNSPALINDLQY